jgi:HAD superfamily hydrolase (TIGR01549 family)
VPPQIPRPLHAVLYDFDGTLIDSAESSFLCYVRTFERFGIPFDREIFERTYSPNWLHTYAAVGLPRDRWDEANALWLDHYTAIECRLIDGVSDAMRRLAKRGICQGIVTSGSRSRVQRDLQSLEILELMDAIVCSEDVTRKKPHPEALYYALSRLGVAADEAVYVGDSPEDVEMARAAGVFSLAIPGNYPNRDALLAASADLYAESLTQAADLLVPPPHSSC